MHSPINVKFNHYSLGSPAHSLQLANTVSQLQVHHVVSYISIQLWVMYQSVQTESLEPGLILGTGKGGRHL